jgi:hypothetical protein
MITCRTVAKSMSQSKMKSRIIYTHRVHLGRKSNTRGSERSASSRAKRHIYEVNRIITRRKYEESVCYQSEDQAIATKLGNESNDAAVFVWFGARTAPRPRVGPHSSISFAVVDKLSMLSSVSRPLNNIRHLNTRHLSRRYEDLISQRPRST